MTVSRSASLGDVLRDIGRSPEWLRFDDGTRLLLLPLSGRVLGMFAGDDPSDFLWTNPALEDVQTARSVFSDRHWVNPGGDRTWLAPEHDFFIADLARIGETYQPPRSIDPGNYHLELASQQAHLAMRTVVKRHRSGSQTPIDLRKQITPTKNPLSDSSTHHVAFAGYTTTVTLTLICETPTPLGLWQLLQLPHGGELFVTTRGVVQPRFFAGDSRLCPTTSLLHSLRWPMHDRSRTHKIGLRANEIIGRAGYVHTRDDGQHDLVVRAFDVDPTGTYIDVPLDAMDEDGYAFQACNVAEPAIGIFAEVEHHAPAIGGSTGRWTHTDVSHVWAYRGSRDAIRSVGRELLGEAFFC